MRLTLPVIVFLCGSLFSVRAIGFGFHGDLGYAGISQSQASGNNLSVSMGLDIGFLTPYFLDAVLTLSIGSVHDRMAFKAAFTGHYTAMLTKRFGIYTGVGVGLDALWGVRIGSDRDPFEANHTGLATKAVFPLGVKFFSKISFEVFIEANFGLGLYNGWTKRYNGRIPSIQNISADMYSRHFYWDVHGRFGMRYWY